MEQWKTVKDFEGYYELRNDGLLYSYPRPHSKGGYSYGNKTSGYYQFCLCKPGIKKYIGAHCLVYETFIGPIPDGYHVHHKDHNPQNNNVDNLELLTIKEHCDRHKEKRIEASNKAHSKPVLQYTKEGEFIAEYPSTMEAERQTGISKHIPDVCNGKRKTAGGFIWRYKED